MQNHEIARRDMGDTLADHLDHADGLMAQQERELVG
jgi:hypothetical protein